MNLYSPEEIARAERTPVLCRSSYTQAQQRWSRLQQEATAAAQELDQWRATVQSQQRVVARMGGTVKP